MDIKNTTVNFCTDWQSRLQQCPTDALVFRSSSPDVKQTEQKNQMSPEGQCGLVCQSQLSAEILSSTSGLKEWRHTLLNRGIVHRTITQFWNFRGVNHLPGYVRLTEIFIVDGIYSLSTIPKVKSQIVQPNTNRVMLLC